MWAVKDGYNGEVIAYCSRKEDAYALAYTDLDVDDLLYVEEPAHRQYVGDASAVDSRWTD
jgi:hypothetical protein